jgi:hypothetical protein
MDDTENSKFEERLAKEIEDAKYEKWKSQKLGHSITPRKTVPNSKMKRGSVVCFIGLAFWIIFGNTAFSTLTDIIGLILVAGGLVVYSLGIKENNAKRRDLGI